MVILPFTRASAATRVNADGNIEKETSNLLLQSNSFDTTWSLSSAISVSGGQAGYDGSNDAWLLERSDASARYVRQNVSSSGVHTFSVYAKPESVDWMYMYVSDGVTNYNAYFDLSSGALGSTSGVIDSAIESAGNGFYRCSISVNASIAAVRLYPAVANGSITGGVSPAGIYIQDAQLEQGLVARDVITTTTTAIYGGITDNVPRLDYTDSSCPALLLEPQRTNLLTHSEYFSDFSLAGGSLTANDTTSPEGFVNAYKFTEDSANSQHRLRKDFAVSAGEHTISLFVKGTSRYLSIYPQTASTAYAVFDLQNETITKSGGANYVSSSIENYGNDWYRIILTCTASASTLKVHFYLSNSGTSEAPTYVGDGSSYLHFYGAQVEAGSYATSYIPTYGSSATRVSENNIITSATDLIGQTEGTMYYEFNSGKNDGADYVVSLSDGSANNRIVIYRSAANQLIAQIRTSAVTYAQLNTSVITENVVYKVALGYANNDVVFYVNGVQIGADTSATIPLTNRIATDNSVGSATFGRPINQLLLFKTRLTNAELATLTTI